MQFFRFILIFIMLGFSSSLWAQKYKILYYGTESIGKLSARSAGGKYSISVHGGGGLGKPIYSSSRKYTLVPGVFSNNKNVKSIESDSMILVRLYESTNGAEWFEPWNLKKPVRTWKGIKLNSRGQVTGINLSSNNLTGILPTRKAFPDSVYVLDNLERIKKYLGKVSINVFKNQLDYGSLEPTHKIIGEPLFEYDSQAFIGAPMDTTVLIGTDFTLSIKTPGEHNTYQWYFNNERIRDATDSIYRIKRINYKDTGAYFCKVWNDIASETVLQTHDIELNVNEPISTTDSLNLVKFYSVTGGDRWRDSWDLYKPVLSWNGLVFRNNHLVEINLSKNNLTGFIPNFMDTAAVFHHLSNLNLSSNRLKGGIPTTLGKLKYLVLLDLDNNQLSGRIPSALTQLERLRTLWLSRNQFTHLPDTIYRWKKLEYLFLNQNQFETMPASFVKLSKLKVLNLNDNRFKAVPEYVSQLRNLEMFYIARNQITKVDPNISTLPLLHLFDLSGNQLANLPRSMRQFDNMKQLKIHENKLQFGVLEPFINRYSVLEYNPQADVGEKKELWLNTDDNFTVSAIVSGKNNTYQWFKNNTLIPNATAPTFTIEKIKTEDSGVYFCLIKNKTANKLTIKRRTVTLYVACNQGLIAKLSTNSPLIYCHDDRISSRLSVDISKKDATIRWYRDSVRIYNASDTFLIAKSVGEYYVQATDQNNCVVNSNHITITSYPRYDVEIRADSSKLYLHNRNLKINKYQWYYYNELINNADAPAYEATEKGVYTLKVTDQNGCQTYSNNISLVNTGIEDQKKTEQVSIFPNPVKDFFYVVTPLSLGEVRIKVFTIGGKQITNIDISEVSLHEKRLDMKNVPAGVYLIFIATDDGDIVRRIIKQ